MHTPILQPRTAAGIRLALKLILCGIVGAACAYLTLRLSDLITYELQGPYNGDSPLFWAMGRGILNGLVPYRDLFETKPPGIFLLSSFSLLFGNDGRLEALLQALTFLLMPVTLALAAMRMHRGVTASAEALLALVSIAFGIMLALYSGERAGEFQPESFGALMICCYAAVIAWDPRPPGIRRIVLASVFLASAIGIKEPFMLAGLAAALVLAQHPRDIIRSFVYPALIAGGAGILALAALGYLEPYLTIYLPEMMGRHIQMGAPLWRRGLDATIIARDLHAQSPLLALAAGTVFAGSIVLRMRSHATWPARACAAASALGALYLASLAVGIGGTYWNHHFVFAVPVYGAFFLVCVREMRRHWGAWEMRLAAATASVLVAAGSFQHPGVDYAARLEINRTDRLHTMQAAEGIDAVLDACGIDRYLFLGANGSHPYGFTRHSPIGPLFVQYEFWMDEHHGAFRGALLNAVDAAGFVVVDSIHLLGLTDVVQRELDTHFSSAPWPCAAGIPLGDRYRYLFRTSDDADPLARALP